MSAPRCVRENGQQSLLKPARVLLGWCAREKKKMYLKQCHSLEKWNERIHSAKMALLVKDPAGPLVIETGEGLIASTNASFIDLLSVTLASPCWLLSRNAEPFWINAVVFSQFSPVLCIDIESWPTHMSSSTMLQLQISSPKDLWPLAVFLFSWQLL